MDRSVLGTHSIEGSSWIRWVHEIRRSEFDGMMKHVPLARDSVVLELGCGDGFQQGLLCQRFARVFAIDPEHRPACADGFVFAVAEALPFPDSTFDLVVSNCVFEHLRDRRRGLKEIVRVLRPGGYTAHIVPARFWKTASLLFNPVGYPMRVAEKWWAMHQVRPESQADSFRPGRAARPGILQVLARWICPTIHGTYRSHFSEYMSYGREQWVEEFRHSQLVPVNDAPLVCATQFGFLRHRFGRVRQWLGQHGLNASRVFVLRRL